MSLFYKFINLGLGGEIRTPCYKSYYATMHNCNIQRGIEPHTIARYLAETFH